MKRNLLLIIICALLAKGLFAVTANPRPIEFVQPDGSKVTISLKGDEKVKWAVTLDGYTLLANAQGAYCYANIDTKGDLFPSEFIAHNGQDRNADESRYINQLRKGLKYSKAQVSMLKTIWEIKTKEGQKSFPTTGNRKLVMILIGFTDKAFTKTQSDFNNLMNQVNYSVNGATGSVYDYFYDNSFNQLMLNTIIAGPYTASNKMAYYGANDAYGDDQRPRELVSEAINKADADVDFSQTDNDGDGYADGLYLIYAGYGEEAGASTNAIWAHAWSLVSPVLKDGVYLSDYSCSSELDGISGTNITNIGVICHEFSHVCGLPDFYDTDYETSGQSFDLGYWDVMAGGSWNNDGKTPPYHNSYSRIMLGWQAANTLSSPQTISLPNSAENNISYQFNTTTTDEFFVVENRQQIGWDAYIPYHGMLIYHVDLNYSGWSSNEINCVPTHQGMDIEEADNVKSDATVTADPFPGSASKTSFTDATTPSSKSWASANTAKPISSISESGELITFKFMGGNVANPSNLTSSNITLDQIQLGWSLDASSNNVLLVYNTSNTFGTPATNTIYSIGQTLSGGGTVLQYSTGTSYMHTSLSEGTTYYYKLWSYNGYAYSGGGTLSAATLNSNIPTGYYTTADGLCEANLKTALYDIIKGHTVVSYDGLWTSFETTDAKSNGKVWDMYSNVEFTFGNDQCGNYSAEGDCYNREHSWPKSWFNDASPMYSDLFHLVPTDGYVNNRRGNYPFGEVSSPTYTSGNGSKLGNCSYPGYTGIVFEPVDEYKGDFARSYFYMATRYENVIASWESNSTEADAVLNGTSYPCFETWILNMLIEWNNEDPVSQKEIDRNEAVYGIQHNRNPFIDHPEYVDAIWGAGCSGSNPVVNLSVSSNTASEASATVITITATASSAVSGDQTISLAVTGTGITSGDYTLGNTTLTIASGATTGSTSLTIVNDADVEGTETATLTISNPSSGITLGSTVSQSITISDDDSGGGTGTTLTYFEDFDTSANWGGGTAGSYNAKTYTNGNDPANDGFSSNYAIKETTSGNTHSGAIGWRLGNNANTYLRYEIDKPVSAFGIFAARWDNSPIPYVTIRYSTNSGSSYTDIETIDGSWFTADKTFKEYTHTFSSPISPETGSKIYIEFITTAGERMLYDDFSLTYIDGSVTLPTVNLSVSSNTASEASATVITITATASAAVTSAQTVALAVTGTGITSGDYSLGNSSITIANGAAQGSTTFTIMDDADVESTETAVLTISSPSSGITLGSTISQNIEITDNDVLPNPIVNLSVSSNSASEANATVITVTATASAAVTGAQTVSLAVSGTDITTGDYSLGNSTITITNGATQGSTTFTVMDDANVESTETAVLTISSPSSGISLGSTVSQNIEITDNDVLPNPTVNLSVSSNTASESNATIITVTATASSAVVGAQTVNLAVTGTNITVSDYSLGNSTITISNGASQGSTTFTVLNDVDVEGTETAVLTISNPSSAITLGSTISQNIEITDNDVLPNPSVNLSVSSNTASEANATIIMVTATASSAVVGAQTVDLAVTGTNITVSDYSLAGSTITIADGATQGSTTFTVLDDANVEGTETAVLTINSPSSGITLGNTDSQNIDIADNDVVSSPFINLSVSSNTASEGSGASITVTATASAAVTGSQTVSLAVSGTGISASDYSLDNSTITIPSGATQGSTIFAVLDDAEVEGIETAVLTISNPSSGITLGSTVSQNIDIADNDVLPNPTVNLSVSSNSASEANATIIIVTASASAAVTGAQTVSLGVSGTGITATDYTLGSSTITITNGATQGSTTFTVVDDSDIESLETAVLTINNPSSGITLGSNVSQNIEISDNDVLPNPTVNLSVSSSSASEANATVITITATASTAVTGAQTVSLAISGTGINTSDYTLGNSTITIANGATQGSTTFTVVDDAEVEGTETVVLTISNPSSGISLGSTISQNISITDNDVLPNPTVNLSVSSNSASEANSTIITVTATASAAVTGVQTVSLAVSGTGITASDYTLGNSTITIANGATQGSTTFTIVDDAEVESIETATLTISGPSSGIALGSTVSQNITITDNDVLPNPTINLSVSSNSASEANATVITVTATASAVVTGVQTVSLAVSGTGITASDYTLGNSTITIANGATQGSTTFTIVDDAEVESIETATLTISGPSSGIALGSTVSQNITITDNDVLPNPTINLSVSSNSASEANATVITVTATASAVVTGAQTVTLTVSGTGITNSDYALSSSTITIANGATQGLVTFSVLDDSDIEEEETATLTISNPSAGIALGNTISQDIVITSNDVLCTLPSVETGLIDIDINSTSALAYGNVISEGSQPLTSEGFCWGTTDNPTIANSFNGNSGTTGNYSMTITNLTIDQEYYVRAFAINSCGTSYGTTQKVLAGNRTSDLIISEYIQGSSDNRFIELYNGTNHSISLNLYQLGIYRDGGPALETYLSLPNTSLPSNGVFIIGNQNQTVYNNTINLNTSSSVLSFDGNDPIGLFKDTGAKGLILTDLVGNIGSSATFAENSELRRNTGVASPNPIFVTSEWTSINTTDNIDGLGFPLQVAIDGFTGVIENSTVKVTWQTTSELNCNYFEVESSADGKSFNEINQVNALGNSTEPKSYQATDQLPLVPVTYYRLKMVYTDGSSAYSKTIAVDTHGLGIEEPEIYYDGSEIILGKMPKGFIKASICLYDISGRQIMNLHLDEIKGQNSYTMPANISRKGVYIIELEYWSQKIAKKIVY